MRALSLLAVLALAACGEAPARPDPRGQQLRAELDQLTRTYADCVNGHATAAPLTEEPAGSQALAIMKTCREARTTLRAKTVEFDQFNHPKRRPDQSETVADASVANLDDQLREAAVVAIVKRQQGMTAAGPGTRI